jgi:hypothetical protein
VGCFCNFQKIAKLRPIWSPWMAHPPCPPPPPPPDWSCHYTHMLFVLLIAARRGSPKVDRNQKNKKNGNKSFVCLCLRPCTYLSACVTCRENFGPDSHTLSSFLERCNCLCEKNAPSWVFLKMIDIIKFRGNAFFWWERSKRVFLLIWSLPLFPFKLCHFLRFLIFHFYF